MASRRSGILMDNVEWDRGYTQRFGSLWIDYETQRWLPKQSACWCRDTIKAKPVEVD